MCLVKNVEHKEPNRYAIKCIAVFFIGFCKDANGNILKYLRNGNNSSKIVMDSLSYKDVKATAPSFTQSSPYNLSWIRGNKSYELSNHLGNVLATISDIKFGADTNNDGVIDYYTADVVGARDYCPFGATMPSRITGTSYRYGFNGKEKDKEGSVQYDYGFRIYDPRGTAGRSIFWKKEK